MNRTPSAPTLFIYKQLKDFNFLANEEVNLCKIYDNSPSSCMYLLVYVDMLNIKQELKRIDKSV